MLKDTSNVRRFLTTTAFIGASLLATAPDWADLGAADSGVRQELSGRKYEAWCGREENIDCIVEFKDGRMVVDGGIGITADQLKQVVYSQKFFRDKHEGLKGSPCVWLGLGPAGCHEFFDFNYISSDGSDLWATI